MRLFFNEYDQIDYDVLDDGATLDDLLQAITVFIDQYPLPCNQCQEGCCRKPWAIEIDSVSARRIGVEAGISQPDFVQTMLGLETNKYHDFDQYVLKKQTSHCPWVTGTNRCRIYQSRPLICRLYTCSAKSQRYNRLREAAAATFLQAFVFEQIINQHNPTVPELTSFARNPALNALDYSLELQKIIDYAAAEGWI